VVPRGLQHELAPFADSLPIGFFGVIAVVVWRPVLGFTIGAKAKNMPKGATVES